MSALLFNGFNIHVRLMRRVCMHIWYIYAETWQCQPINRLSSPDPPIA